MKVHSSWQWLLTLIMMFRLAYVGCAIGAILVAWMNWPYVNASILLVMLVIYVSSIPLNLNYTRKSYKLLLLWFAVHVIFSNSIYAWHYAKAGLVSANGQLTHIFRDGFYFSVTTWATLGYGDLVATPSMRLVTSIEALSSLVTIPIGVSLVWFMLQESTVSYTDAYLDRGDYDQSGHLAPRRPGAGRPPNEAL